MQWGCLIRPYCRVQYLMTQRIHITKFMARSLTRLMLGAICLVGCDNAGDDPAISDTPVVGTGMVRGVVHFSGTAPTMEPIPNAGCHANATPIMAETAVVNANGTLANVFVSLEGAGRWNGASRPVVELDQVNCQFVPHVVGVQVGQTLNVKSADPTLHNVHWDPRQNKPANFGMNKAGNEKSVTFPHAEIFRVRCDVHPWMSAYVGVFDNPFFSLTDSTGAFQIDQIPSGTYTLVAWHETYGRLTQNVTVDETGTVEATFEYKVP